LLIAWSVAYLVTSEVVVAPGIVETRGWLRMGRHVRRQTILVSRDQPLVRMPDGRWWLGGRTVGLNVPRWETTRLVDVLTGAGIAIIDTQTAWRRSHRRRIWAYRVSWAAWLCGLWAISPSPWATTSCRSSSAWRSCWPV
jgi:hypothetical protein